MKTIGNIFKVIGILFVFILCCVIFTPNETRNFINLFTDFDSYVEQVDYDTDEHQLTMDDESLLFTVNAKLNGADMEFILDTGCSSILISSVELVYLKRRGLIKDDDYIGQTISEDADGDQTTCNVFNIRELEVFGYKITNVQCMVSSSKDSSMLLGQEVLSKFSKVIIDYDNHAIKVEPK